MEQRTDEWHAARLGKLTASRIADAFAKTSKGWGAGRRNLIAQLICERLTGTPTAMFTNAAMQWGTDCEPQARAAYAFHMGEEVEEVGFVDHGSIAMAGASPDGLIGSVGLVEIKCPNTATHLDTLDRAEAPAEYFPQMQWQMACTGRQWCDFASFDPRLPEPLRLFVARVPRDDAYIREQEALAVEFLAEVDERIASLRRRYELAAAA